MVYAVYNDQQQRQQALNPNQSFIVQAPAGSGKTSLLIQRFLVLLARAKQIPEEILAITFTRKAAAEMRLRLFQALEAAATEPEPQDHHKATIWRLARAVLQRDQTMGWNLTDNPNCLRIYTIDGFCNGLTKQMPITSGFGAQPNIVAGVDANKCYQHAVENLLTTTPYSQALTTMLLHLDNDYTRITTLLVDMLARRDQWLPHITNHNDLAAGLANILNENLNNCKSTLPQHLQEQLLAAFTNWQNIATALLTKNYQWRKKVAKTQNLLPEIHTHEEFRANLQALLLSPPLQYTPQQQNIITSLITVLKTVVGHLKLVFQEQEVADYIEIALAALQALGEEDNPTDLALKLDYKIQHILVDEFQDTSITQYHLLEKLTAGWQPDDGRTLFLVGDPMQSIYKFREAKVGLFLRAKHEGINNIKLQNLTLCTNFRSHEPLINWVNQTFSKVMPQAENIIVGAIPFIPACAMPNATKGSSAHIHTFQANDYQGEAQQLVKIIQADPGDNIAILVRNRAHITHIIPALQKAQIPYQALELETLNENMLIQDLFSLTRALLNKSDRIAWLSILRAPWFGLTLKELHAIANLDPDTLIWDVIVKQGEYMDSPLRVALNDVNRKPLQQLVEDTWVALNGPAYVNQQDLQNARTYFDLLDTVDDVETLAAKLATLYADPPVIDGTPVQIMTIHKAKGLEFDTVILPGLNRVPRHSDKPLLLWNERPTGQLIMAPINATDKEDDPIYRYLQFEDKQRVYYETGRLLYVAVTRARKALHLLGCVDDKSKHGSLMEQLLY